MGPSGTSNRWSTLCRASATTTSACTLSVWATVPARSSSSSVPSKDLATTTSSTMRKRLRRGSFLLSQRPALITRCSRRLPCSTSKGTRSKLLSSTTLSLWSQVDSLTWSAFCQLGQPELSFAKLRSWTQTRTRFKFSRVASRPQETSALPPTPSSDL